MLIYRPISTRIDGEKAKKNHDVTIMMSSDHVTSSGACAIGSCAVNCKLLVRHKFTSRGLCAAHARRLLYFCRIKCVVVVVVAAAVICSFIINRTVCVQFSARFANNTGKMYTRVNRACK